MRRDCVLGIQLLLLAGLSAPDALYAADDETARAAEYQKDADALWDRERFAESIVPMSRAQLLRPRPDGWQSLGVAYKKACLLKMAVGLFERSQRELGCSALDEGGTGDPIRKGACNRIASHLVEARKEKRESCTPRDEERSTALAIKVDLLAEAMSFDVREQHEAGLRAYFQHHQGRHCTQVEKDETADKATAAACIDGGIFAERLAARFPEIATRVNKEESQRIATTKEVPAKAVPTPAAPHGASSAEPSPPPLAQPVQRPDVRTATFQPGTESTRQRQLELDNKRLEGERRKADEERRRLKALLQEQERRGERQRQRQEEEKRQLKEQLETQQRRVGREEERREEAAKQARRQEEEAEQRKHPERVGRSARIAGITMTFAGIGVGLISLGMLAAARPDLTMMTGATMGKPNPTLEYVSYGTLGGGALMIGIGAITWHVGRMARAEAVRLARKAGTLPKEDD